MALQRKTKGATISFLPSYPYQASGRLSGVGGLGGGCPRGKQRFNTLPHIIYFFMIFLRKCIKMGTQKKGTKPFKFHLKTDFDLRVPREAQGYQN
jgi:hypothetical protein